MARRKMGSLAPGSTPPAALVFAVLGFFVMTCLNVYGKGLAVVLAILMLAVGAVCARFLRERMGLTMLVLIAMVLMGCVSAFYAVSGDYALRDALHMLVALCGVLLLLVLFGNRAEPGRKIATVLGCSGALMGLISIDLISTHWLSTPLLGFLGLFTKEYQNIIFVENGVRINSFFGAPNIFAGCVGIGVLLSLGLAVTAENPKERRLHLCCLYCSALAFVLAFSMGATAAIAAAFVLYLLLEHKQRRGDLLLLMGKTLVLVMVSVIPISMTSLGEWDGFQPIPLLCTAAGAALLCLADKFVFRRLAEVLRHRSKLLLILLAVLLVVLMVFAAAACLWTGPVSLSAGQTLRRAAYPEAGSYTAAALGGDGVSVMIESQNLQQTMMHTSTVLYEGQLSQAMFEVPEDSMVVYFNFAASKQVDLEHVVCRGPGGDVVVPLGYKLLPNFIANRLQGLKANENAIQRTVFFNDGLKLFQQSPVIGNGLGSFEMAYSSVQEFYYETKYVHNHYIETLLSTGVVGFALFLGLLAVSAAAVLKSRKKEDFHPLTPALGALLVFMAVHAGLEVVFSSGFYLPLAFGVFLLIDHCCGDAIRVKWLGQKTRTAVLVVTAVFVSVFTILVGCNISAKNQVKRNLTYESLERATKKDVFDWSSYANSYVVSVTAGADLSEEVQQKALSYAKKLERVDSRWVHYRLTHFYLHLGQTEKAMEQALEHIRYNASNNEKWNELFDLLAVYENDSQAFSLGVARIAAFMEQWDAENMGEVLLSETSQDFLTRVLSK